VDTAKVLRARVGPLLGANGRRLGGSTRDSVAQVPGSRRPHLSAIAPGRLSAVLGECPRDGPIDRPPAYTHAPGVSSRDRAADKGNAGTMPRSAAWFLSRTRRGATALRGTGRIGSRSTVRRERSAERERHRVPRSSRKYPYDRAVHLFFDERGDYAFPRR
jgi:hypothetical protein